MVTEVTQDQLQRAIEGMHGCKATYRYAVPVDEQFNGKAVWQGVVSVFDVDHPKASTAYAWSSAVDGSDKRRFYAVLGIPPVNSALDAVRASIVAENKPQ